MKKNLRLIRRCVGLAAALVALACPAFAAEKPVWRIGVFDKSSSEFRSQGVDYSDLRQDPVYRVGKSKDGEDWQRFQPGPANGMAGGRVHPFTIVFELPETPRGVFRLRIAILYETPRLSTLHLEINGHAGLFYFHPQLDYAAGDWEGTFVPLTSTDEKRIELPAAWMRRGENRLVLTALDDPAAVENSLGSIAPGHTGIVYDALELTQDPEARYDRARVQAKVIPSIFYRNTPAGPAEVVEVFVEFAGRQRHGEVRLAVGGKTWRERFVPEPEFGECRVEINVPEWTGEAAAKLTIRSNGTRDFPVKLGAAKKWTLFIVPHEHLDIGFTDYPEKVAELQSQSVDGAMEAIRQNPDFRWTLDGYWIAQSYLAGRSKDKQREFLDMIRDSKVILPAQFANQHTGTASLEGLIRSLYGSHFFAQRNGLPVGAAHITDVPSYSWSYASVLHDAGVKYFLAASNSWRAPAILQGRWNEKSPFYWEGPDGGRVLMWYSRAYLQTATLFGTPPRLAAVHDSLPVFLQAYSRPAYKADAAIIFGTQLENTQFSKEQAELVKQWQALYTWPRLEYSTVGTALGAIEKQFQGQIPVMRGDFGPYWEDGFGSDSFYTALHRQNQQRILTAEKLGSIPAALRSGLRPDAGFLARAWENILRFDEHTWTYVGATTQPESVETRRQTALKRAEATEASDDITRSIDRSWGQLESLLAPKENSLVVFNSLSWARGGTVSADLQDGSGIFDAVTGKEVALETVSVGKSTALPGFGGGYRHVRFFADDVPGVGYKLYAVRPAASTGETGRMVPSGNVFESPYYRIAIDPASGGVASILDKQLNRELVDTESPYRFGAYVYVSGADNMPNNSLYRYGAALKPPKLTPTPAAGGGRIEAHTLPWGTFMVMEFSAPNTPLIRTEITLFNNAKRIEFSFHVRKDYVLTKEAAYIAFPFAAEKPAFAYETQNGWVDPARDELPGGSREWYAVNHWAAVRGDGFAAAVTPRDAPLVNFGDIVRGNWPERFAPASATIFSWLMNNYWGTNFVPGQGGDFTFRYAVTSDAQFDAAALTRAGWEAMTPLEADPIGATLETSPLPSDQASLLKIDNPDVVLVTWKQAEEGEGSIMRLEEIAGRAGKVHLSSPFLTVEKAWRCSALEENQSVLPATDAGIELDVHPFEVVTVRLLIRPGKNSSAAQPVSDNKSQPWSKQ